MRAPPAAASAISATARSTLAARFRKTGGCWTTATRIQSRLSFSLAASDIRAGVQGGSQTTWTLTSLTPFTPRTLYSTSGGIASADGQAGEVSVMRTDTFDSASMSTL